MLTTLMETNTALLDQIHELKDKLKDLETQREKALALSTATYAEWAGLTVRPETRAMDIVRRYLAEEKRITDKDDWDSPASQFEREILRRAYGDAVYAIQERDCLLTSTIQQLLADKLGAVGMVSLAYRITKEQQMQPFEIRRILHAGGFSDDQIQRAFSYWMWTDHCERNQLFVALECGTDMEGAALLLSHDSP